MEPLEIPSLGGFTGHCMFVYFRSRRGTIAFDLTIIIPIFLALSIGMIEYSRGLMACNLIDNAAIEGVHTALQANATNHDVTSAVQEYLKSSLGVDASDVSVAITIVPETGNQDPRNQVAECRKGDRITAKVRVPPGKVALLPGEAWRTQKFFGASTIQVE